MIFISSSTWLYGSYLLLKILIGGADSEVRERGPKVVSRSGDSVEEGAVAEQPEVDHSEFTAASRV